MEPLAVQAAPVGLAQSRRLSPGSIREKRLVTRGKIAGRYTKLVRQKFDLNIHPRTIERAVAGKKTPR
jgi:hypothetical protein